MTTILASENMDIHANTRKSSHHCVRACPYLRVPPHLSAQLAGGMTTEYPIPTMKYDFSQIEERWQSKWADEKTFRSPGPGDVDFDRNKPKYYVLDMFPYPSGVGLHVGHPLGYIATDIVARYKRMQGYNVLHPMGYDAFGLPAEQFAVEHGVHPRITTEKNIANMTRQLKRLGLGYDWDRSFATIEPDYYKWTQWIFLQLYHAWFNPYSCKAEPISELVNMLSSGEYAIDMDGNPVPVDVSGAMELLGGVGPDRYRWHELSEDDRREFLDNMRLAYIDEVPVNWCPALGTVLANEEVTNEGRSERGNHPVFRRPLKQWMLRITAYCRRLLDDLEEVDWPEPIKLMQRNWIGKSQGAKVDFTLDGGDGEEIITVFTTRPDTLFGSTYMVLAPEHPLVSQITTGEQLHAVTEYQNEAARKSELDRQADTREKTGVFTGAYAVNPVNGERIPIWIADYVMMGYGTGAIMAVPAHDQRDFEFAGKFDIEIRVVVMPDDTWLKNNRPDRLKKGGDDPDKLRADYVNHPGSWPIAFTGTGYNVNSHNNEISLDNQETGQAKDLITQWLGKIGRGRSMVQYKLRDWLFSRQRYWGEPFPILHGPDGELLSVGASELPVELPELDDFRPRASDDPDAPPQPPLSNAPENWKYVERDGRKYTREFNTMPQWAGSCWYYLRYLDPKNNNRFVGKDAEQYWMKYQGKHGQAKAGGVDLYVGGAEHAVLHLLYARFWHKVLYDLGHVSTAEPFGRLFNQGYIQAYAYRDHRGIAVPAEEVVDKKGRTAAEVQDEKNPKLYYNNQPVTREMGKMGKSLKNAITPDEICDEYGCDTLRLYEMYLGPLDQSKIWRTRDIVGVHRFLQRLWRNMIDEETGELLVAETAPSKELAKLSHRTIKRVTDGMETLSFNTAIAALIELNNAVVSMAKTPRYVAETIVVCLSPIAPHIAEELWEKLGHSESVIHAPWPTYDDDMLVEDEIEYPVQVNGKLRGKVTVPADAADDTVKAAALQDENVAKTIEGKTIRKTIVIKGRLINLVVG